MTASEVATRVDRLFQLAHGYGEAERSATDVAAAVSAELGTTITAGDIVALRAGTYPATTDSLLSAIAKQFHAPANYLIDLAATAKHDMQFRALIAARDAKVNGIHFRGGDEADDRLESLVTELEGLAAEQRAGAVTRAGGTPA
jgi:hypothetical protein